MDLKQLLRRVELPFLYGLAGLWLLVYVLSRTVLEMATYESPKNLVFWIAASISPLVIYASLRMMFSQGAKWYAAIGYFLVYLLLGTLLIQYIIIDGEILLSSAVRPSQHKELKLLEVEKVFKRKLGFDHTAVKVAPHGTPLVMEARPYAYFFLKDKTAIQSTLGTSWLGNTYVVAFEVPVSEKLQARWAHSKDWLYRYRLLWGFFGVVIIVVMIQMKFFPRKPGYQPKPLGFWKFLGILMGSLFLLGLLAYAALWIYITYFGMRHA